MSKPMEPRVRWMLTHDRAVNDADNPRILVEVTEFYNTIRYIFALDRWPEDMSRPDLRDNFKAAWGELGSAACETDWCEFPTFEPAPGNDYVDIIGYARKVAAAPPPTPRTSLCPEPRCHTPQPGPHTGYCKHALVNGGAGHGLPDARDAEAVFGSAA